MKSQSKNTQPFIMVIFLAVGLLCASQFNTKVRVGELETKKVDALSDVTLKNKAKKIPA